MVASISSAVPDTQLRSLVLSACRDFMLVAIMMVVTGGVGMDRGERCNCGGRHPCGHSLVCVRCCGGITAGDKQSSRNERPIGAEVPRQEGHHKSVKGVKGSISSDRKTEGARGCPKGSTSGDCHDHGSGKYGYVSVKKLHGKNQKKGQQGKGRSGKRNSSKSAKKKGNWGRKNRAPKVKKMNLRIMNWNIDGFDDPTQRLNVGAYLWKHRVDIAVLTESRLLDEDIFQDMGKRKGNIPRIKIDHYRIAR